MATVLIVDDSPIDRRLAKGLLEKRSDLAFLFAADGKEALDEIEQSQPDVVLTDLQMPEMNGLELVRAVRARFPLVPVILMTAQGSEDIAVQALSSGAASYVPKSRLAHELLNTVETVLGAAHAERHHARLMECLIRNQWLFVLDNDPSLVAAVVDHMQQHVTRLRLCDETGRIRLAVALEEALLNSLYHGNLEISSELRETDMRAYYALADVRRHSEPYRSRTVQVEATLSRDEAVYVVRDDGPGYDPSSLPDPTDPANLEKVSGRGLLLIRTFMDEVRHNAKGNEITMIKRRED
ncbi:MAG TPA: response regulator [Pirellulales bacterium]|nr:response regulator [Pirellulales bacterium]